MARFVTTEQAADILSEQYEFPVTKRTLEGLRGKNAGPSYYKVGKYVMYKEPDLAKWVEENIERVVTASGQP